MAGAGYKLFNTGDVLTAQQVNEYLMQQTVMSFADSAARTTALSGVLAEGMVSYLRDTNVVEIYTGASWVSLDDPNAIQNSIVDAKGDLISATADNTPARLASSGVNGHVLKVNTSTSTGLEWGSGGGGQLTETAFTSSNASWTIPTGVTGIWALVVGGGGGGGAAGTTSLNNAGGGGGAGQIKEQFFAIAGGDTTLNITVGGGGAAGTNGAKGSSGSASTIVGNTSATTYVTSAGGGGGGGGGSGNSASLAGGSSGGNGNVSAAVSGGGGGFGSSASDVSNGILAAVPTTVGGATGTATTLGVTGYNGGQDAVQYAGQGIVIWNRALGGGGGGCNTAVTSIAANFGGTGRVAANVAGTNGSANTGGGGSGAATTATTARTGGNGGSGLVVLRYIA